LKKVLIIQTAFIGDVILATALVEKIHAFYPDAAIDFLVRKGNETLLLNNPKLNCVLVWDKKQNKLSNLFKIIKDVRSKQYDLIINPHRFASSGLIMALSGATTKVGFTKNPLSFLYNKKLKHEIGNGTHEVDRNQLLIEAFTDSRAAHPKLYPSTDDITKTAALVNVGNYICIAPASVWFTKQLPVSKWLELIATYQNSGMHIYLIGAPGDKSMCDTLVTDSKYPLIKNLAGELTFLQSAVLMQQAQMNYVNDSAPLHICSAMNAKVSVVFCSTVPSFGFGPLAAHAIILETKENLSCRPCGLHGFKACPQGHFKCALTIEMKPSE
jgi:ADP-heptose:LPS heptosyltransferase